MKATLKISRSHLLQLLRCIDRVIGVPDEDTHSDVNLIVNDEYIKLYSFLNPVFISHKVKDGTEISVDVESEGKIAFNTDTLYDIVKNSEEGSLEIVFTDEQYLIQTPGGDSLSPVNFELPRHTDTSFKEQPTDLGELYSIETVSRTELKSALGTMDVIGEFVNISVTEDGNFSISMDNKVTGNAELKKEGCTTDISKMSQLYMVGPLKEFVSTMTDASEVEMLVSDNNNICLRASVDNWTAELHLGKKAGDMFDTYLDI
ncbi:hypothetical protein [Halorientalis sp. IM1011]|uniref:hypothetical protein n=1 Tax=Halorientalis sp. IM1011 TaxID=1932360 RepID=UPI0012FCC412|nr:hypothetical protein [Halorientalis sp. IM1011]